MRKGVRLLLFVFIIAGQVNAQWLVPPYEIQPKEFPEPFIRSYWTEADLDGDGVKEIVTREGHDVKSYVEQIKFFTPEGNIISAYNSGDYDSRFADDYVLETEKRDYYLFVSASYNSVTLFAVHLEPEKIVFRKIYTYGSVKKTPQTETYFLHIPEKKILIVAFNSNFPAKNEWRRIVAFDTENFNVLWEKRTADFILSFTYSKANPDKFYYSTVSYSNGLIISDGVFYRLHADITFSIDTIFTKKTRPVPPEPDMNSTALNFSTDMFSYIVEMSVDNGETTWRKKTGEQFIYTKFQRPYTDSTVLTAVYNKPERSAKIYSLNTATHSLTEFQNCPPPDATGKLLAVNFTVNELFFLYKDKVDIFKIKNGKPEFFKSIKNVAIVLPYTNAEEANKYRILVNAEKKLVCFTDSDYNVLGTFPAKYLENRQVKWSKTFHTFVLANDALLTSLYLEFKKLPFYKRISPELQNFLFWTLLILLIVLLFVWFLTMKISSDRLKKKNKELEETTLRLVRSEKLALLGTVAASFAHQLNSPLGAILNSAERLQRKYDDKNIDLIKRSALYSKTLVQKFLSASRSEPSKDAPCTDFNELWSEWQTLFNEENAKRNIEVIADLKAETKARIPKSELFEIISNLMFNARDAILASDGKERKIKLSTRTEGEKYIIEIEDTGTGFGEKDLNKIFEPFYSTKEKGKGTGLGLWIVKKLTERAKGEIYAENTAEGAKVKLIFNICKNGKNDGEI